MDYNSEHVMTLANSIIGVSVLAMPYCFKQCGIILSIVMLIISSVISRLACHFLLKSAILARRKTFEFLAFHVFGAPGKLVVEIGIIGFLIGTCIAFFVVMGDLGPDIVAELTGAHITSAVRSSILMGLALFCVLPLGLLRNVDSLTGVSKATIGFYCCLVLKIVIESAPYFVNGDWFYKVELWRPAGILQCIPIFSMALFCQTQLFEIYQAIPNATLQRMNNMIRVAVNICTCVYIFVGMFGYIAFYQLPFSGNILMSFRPSVVSDLMKVGFVLSVAFSFPLVIFPCRASLYSLIYKRGYTFLEGPHINYIPEGRFKLLTFIIVLVSLIVGILIPNIELVLGLVGSTIGVMICVLFPVTCFICLSPKNTNERILAQMMLFIGVLVMVLGTYANLYAIEEIRTNVDMKIAVVNPQNDGALPIPVENSASSKILKVLNDNPSPKIPEESKLKDPADEPQVLKEARHEPPQPLEVEVRHEPPQPVEPAPASEEAKVVQKQPVEPVEERKPEAPKEEVKQHDVVKPDKQEGLQEASKAPSIEKKEVKDVNEQQAKKEELIETLEKHNLVQQELVEQQKKLIEVIKQQQALVNEKEEEIQKVKKEKIEAVKEIQNIAQKAIESLSAKEEVPQKTPEKAPEKEADQKKFEGILPANIRIDKAPDEQPPKEKLAEVEKLVPLPIVVSNNLTIFGQPREIQKEVSADAKPIEHYVKNEIKIDRIDKVNVNIKHEINVLNSNLDVLKKQESDGKDGKTPEKKEIVGRDILFEREKREAREKCEGETCKNTNEAAALVLNMIKQLSNPEVINVNLDGLRIEKADTKADLKRVEAKI